MPVLASTAVTRIGLSHSKEEKQVKKMGLRALTTAFYAVLSIVPAYAAWGRWQTIGDGFVRVSFSLISEKNICTWRIKNTGSNTLARFDFSYSYAPADNPSLQKIEKDILPYPLKPGASVGGWTVYSASTHHCPVTLVILKLERSN
jgi:hypothetical protein